MKAVPRRIVWGSGGVPDRLEVSVGGRWPMGAVVGFGSFAVRLSAAGDNVVESFGCTDSPKSNDIPTFPAWHV